MIAPRVVSVVRGTPSATNPWLDLRDEAGYLVGPGCQGFGPPAADLWADQPAGQDGELARGSRVQPSTVFLPVDVHGSAGAQFRSRLRTLYRVFNPRPDRGATDAWVTVRAVNDGGESRQITGRPTLVTSEDQDAVGYAGSEQFAVVGLSVRCPLPWWSDASPTVQRFATGGVRRKSLIGSGKFIPIRLSPSQIAGGLNVTVNSDVDVWPVWSIRGPGTGLVVRSTTLGEQFAISGSILPGQTVTVDTRRGVQSARDQAGTNLWPRMTGSSLFPLVVGANAVTVSLTDASSESYVEVSYARLYLDAA